MSNNKFDERFANALEELSESLLKVAQLCDDETHGEDFNTEILAIKLGHLWSKSLDEMAGDIKDVVEEMRNQPIEAKTKKIELAKMFMQPYVTLKKVTSIKNTIDGNECLSLVLTHQRAFSNMFGITDEDLNKGCYRFLVKNPFEVFQATYDGVDMIYTYDTEKNEYVPVCSCDELKTNDELAEKLKHYLTLNETFGDTTKILEHSFENPHDVDLLIKQGDNEIVCSATPFCYPAGRFLVPVRADNENGFVLTDVPYEYSFYRTTYNDKASYVAVPKNTPIFFEYTFYSDCKCLEQFSNQYLTAKFFNSNIERSYNSLGAFMKDKQVVEICKNNALDKLNLIDPKAKDTKVFMVGEV